MQKEIQCVGTGMALDKMLAEGEMSVKLQEVFMFNAFHGKGDDPNSTGLVETILSGAGIVDDMCFSEEVDITDPNTPTEEGLASRWRNGGMRRLVSHVVSRVEIRG